MPYLRSTTGVTSKTTLVKNDTTATGVGYTGQVGEITVDTDTDQLYVHDGSTAGGIIQGPPLGSIMAVATGFTNAYTLPASGAVGVGGWMLCDGATIPAAATLEGTSPTLTDGRFLQGNTHGNVGGTGAGTKSLSSGELGAHTHTSAAHTHTSAAHCHTSTAHTHNTGTHVHNISHNHSGCACNVGNHGHSIYGPWPPDPHRSTSMSAGGSHYSGTMANDTHRATSGGGGAHAHATTINNCDRASGACCAGVVHSCTPGNVGACTPGATGSTTPGATGSTGSGTAFDVIPKYLRVVYVMRVQ